MATLHHFRLPLLFILFFLFWIWLWCSILNIRIRANLKKNVFIYFPFLATPWPVDLPSQESDPICSRDLSCSSVNAESLTLSAGPGTIPSFKLSQDSKTPSLCHSGSSNFYFLYLSIFLICKILCIFNGYILMSLNICTHLWNHHRNQGTKYGHHL